VNPSIAIILVNWNGKEDSLECLSSLKKISYAPHEIILVDNGSSDDSVACIQQSFPDIHLIETKKNLGFAGGNNVAIRWALEKKFDFLFLLNNDTIVAPDILEELLAASRAKPKAGILGANVLRYKDPTTIDHLGGIWDPSIAEFHSPFTEHKDHESIQMQKVDYVSGCAFFVKKELFEAIGLLEEKFFLIWEESDFCARAQKQGFEIWTVPSAKIWHKVSASFTGKPHLQYYWWRNRLLWIERNCSKKELFALYKNLLLKEITHTFKIRFLKELQYIFLRLFTQKSLEKKREKLLRHRASCRGILDYFFRRFGIGPLWLTKKTSPQKSFSK
jgi:GT2 family glycosyltransferase